MDSHSDVYSLGVLILEFWRKYAFSRGLGGFPSGGGANVVGIATSSGTELVQPEETKVLLDVPLVKSMLADDPFDRPDCFEILNGFIVDGK